MATQKKKPNKPQKKEVTVTPRNQEKHDFAYLLYMQGVTQQDICKRVGVSAPTIQSWKEAGAWAAKRAAKTISIDTLLQKAMAKIDTMLDNEDFNADSFAKAVQQLKVLKRSTTVDDDINTLTMFSDFLIARRQTDKEVTEDLIKKITQLQDAYIQSRLK